MKISTEFYGRLKEEFSQLPIELNVEADSTIEAIYLQLCASHQSTPDTQVIKPILNDTFAEWQDKVSAHDVIGFFPPAAGG